MSNPDDPSRTSTPAYYRSQELAALLRSANDDEALGPTRVDEEGTHVGEVVEQTRVVGTLNLKVRFESDYALSDHGDPPRIDVKIAAGSRRRRLAGADAPGSPADLIGPEGASR